MENGSELQATAGRKDSDPVTPPRQLVPGLGGLVLGASGGVGSNSKLEVPVSRVRSFTESSGQSGTDSDFGLSDRQLEGLKASRVVEQKISFSPAVDANDADFGLADSQIEALAHQAGSSQQAKVAIPVLPLSQLASSGPPAESQPAARRPLSMPQLPEASPRTEGVRSLRAELLEESSSMYSGSTAQFDDSFSDPNGSFAAAARGAGSTALTPRASRATRGSRCLTRVRQCLVAAFWERGR